MTKNSEIRKALRQRPRIAVGPNFEEKITMKEARRRNEDYMAGNYIERSFLIVTKTFTVSKLKSYEKKGLLQSYKEGGVVRYKRKDIVVLIASESGKKHGQVQ